MRFHSIFFLLLLSVNVFATNDNLIHMNFNGLKLQEFVNVSSKIMNKNILVSTSLEGTIDFVSSKPILKKNMPQLFVSILESKGYKVIQEKTFLKVIKKDTTLSPRTEPSKVKKIIKIQKKNDIIHLVRLKNIEVSEVIKNVELILNKKYPKKEERPILSLDNESNGILIIGTKKQIDFLTLLIQQFDNEKVQVYVKARIIEVSEIRTKNVGLKYGITGFNKQGVGKLSTFSSLLNGGVIPAIADFGLSATTLQNGLALGATINLLKENNAVDVISEPSILCMNNKESLIYVGETKSFQTGTTTNDSGTTTSYKREDIGLTLKVKPRVSFDNNVTLSIETILEDVKINAQGLNPDTSKKRVTTTAVVTNGESVILGGLIKNKATNIESKVPLLGDIPLLGNAFKNDYWVKDKINLIVIVTPYIISSPSKLSIIRQHVDELKLLEDQYLKQALIHLNKENKTMKKEKVLKNVEAQSQFSAKKRHNKMIKEYFGI